MPNAIFSIRWNNPYTEPPNGQPRILWSTTVEWTGDTTIMEQAYQDHGLKLGCGYGQAISIETKAPKQWSQERKGKYRRSRLMNRLQKKYPLLANQLYEQELNKRPEYFSL